MWKLPAFAGAAVTASSTISAAAEKPAPTYHKDIVRILQRNCQDCHRPNQEAPFSFFTYEQARKRATDLARVTADRVMPPWPASSSVGGPFRDARVLTTDEIATLQAWVDARCAQGDPKDAPAPRTFSSDWALGEPDVPDDARAVPVATLRERRVPRVCAQDEFSGGSLDPSRRFSSEFRGHHP
jgi:hypothetical protein